MTGILTRIRKDKTVAPEVDADGSAVAFNQNQSAMSTAGFLFLICKMKMQANGMAHVKDMSDRWKKRTLICVTVVDQWPIAVGSICMMIGCGEECK